MRDADRALDSPLSLGSEGLVYMVERGASLRAVAADLHARGVLADRHYLVWYGRWSGDAQRIKAGEYRIPPGATPRRLLEQLVEGRVVQHAITLVEGWTFAQALRALQAHPLITATLPPDDAAAVLAAVGAAAPHPEGLFLPDTYHFTRGAKDVEILTRAHRAMQARLRAEWEGRAPGLPLEDPYEALILASIVEKETGAASERARIAGVFVRRLRRGMRLETDPTVIYGLGEAFDGNLTRRHLREEQDYNTYRRHGLPPTPIALPGAASIRAALHPAPGAALYFVSRGDGTHHFSETYEEHRRAVDRFQRRPRTAQKTPPEAAGG